MQWTQIWLCGSWWVMRRAALLDFLQSLTFYCDVFRVYKVEGHAIYSFWLFSCRNNINHKLIDNLKKQQQCNKQIFQNGSSFVHQCVYSAWCQACDTSEWARNGKLSCIIETSEKIAQNALQQRSKSDADWNGLTHLLSNTRRDQSSVSCVLSQQGLDVHSKEYLRPPACNPYTHLHTFTHNQTALSTGAAIQKP